jgi:hypothetical protein
MAEVWSFDPSSKGGQISTLDGDYCLDAINGQYIRHASCRQLKCFLIDVVLSQIVDKSNKLVLGQCNQSQQQQWLFKKIGSQISIELLYNQSSFLANLIHYLNVDRHVDPSS